MADHQPVLVREVLEGLKVKADGWYVDGTYGRGGHSAEILSKLGEQGRLLALDKDPDALRDAMQRFARDPRFTVMHCGFERLRDCAEPWLEGRRLAGVLLDLGVSSPQLEAAERGFSFSKDGPLDMRLDSSRGATAAEWLAQASRTELTRVLRDLGEEPRAAQIAGAIVAERARAPIVRTSQLAALVARASGYRRGRIHPATRVFQALRIHVNQELTALAQGLAQSLQLLAGGGRLCVISFHSLEDRIVKRFMAREAKGDPVYAGLPRIPAEARPRLRLVGGLVRPSAAEIQSNPRARSARLRIAERLEEQP